MKWLEHCGRRMEQHWSAALWVCPECHGVVTDRDFYIKWGGIRP